jgi:DNA ligase-1
MQRFTQLYFELDQTTKTAEKLEALERYFTEAPVRDAAWALFFISGKTLSRAVSSTLLQEWTAVEAGLPLWLVHESHEAVGDLAEALALLLPDAESHAVPLHELVETRLVPLRDLAQERRRQLLVQTWRELDSRQRLVWNKLMMGSFRVGVARTLVVRALGSVAGISPAVMAHRLMGSWLPQEEDFRRLLVTSGDRSDPAQPYPFYLAYQLDQPVESLGAPDEWQVEWKWDGIRAQLIRRQDEVLIWSRGEELVTDRFPEIRKAAFGLPDGIVLDGEILPWRDNQPLPFGALQRRIGRKQADLSLQALVPVAFMSYDLLEFNGEDLRQRPLAERRGALETVLTERADLGPLILSPILAIRTWDDVLRHHSEAQSRNAEGLMLKRLTSAYGVGRRRGDWWKWKVDPYHIDAVLIYAQQGSGRRASLYTDYTFGVWERGQLVPVAKAYSGLTDAEIREVDTFIRRNTIDKMGPVRVVRPYHVFELAFEGVRVSSRHKAGLAVRFPRMARWRRDKKAEDADTLDALRSLLPASERSTSLLPFDP